MLLLLLPFLLQLLLLLLPLLLMALLTSCNCCCQRLLCQNFWIYAANCRRHLSNLHQLNFLSLLLCCCCHSFHAPLLSVSVSVSSKGAAFVQLQLMKYLALCTLTSLLKGGWKEKGRRGSGRKWGSSLTCHKVNGKFVRLAENATLALHFLIISRGSFTYLYVLPRPPASDTVVSYWNMIIALQYVWKERRCCRVWHAF